MKTTALEVRMATSLAEAEALKDAGWTLKSQNGSMYLMSRINSDYEVELDVSSE